MFDLMNTQGRTIVFVTGYEAEVAAATQKMWENADKKTDPRSPMAYCQSEMDRVLLREYQRLQKKYQVEFNLPFPPVLLPQQVQQHPMVDLGIAAYHRSKEPPTEMELARMLIQKVRLCRHGPNIYHFNGIYYAKLSDDELKTLIVDNLRHELSVNGNSRQLTGIVNVLMAEPDIVVSGTYTNYRYLCLENGVLDLCTFEWHNFSPKYFFTSKMPVYWVGECPCPVFDNFIGTITGGDSQLALRFLEAIGYVLSPDNLAKRFLLLQGRGDTGKSVLGNLIKSFFDPGDVSSVDIFKFGDRFALSNLVDKRVNISMDLSNSALNEQAVSTIKQLTGQDSVQVEEKYKKAYSAKVECKLVFGTNHVLHLNSLDAAFSRRMLLLPFQYPIPKHRQDPHLLQKLREERSGILYKALRAFQVVAARHYVFTGDDTYNMYAMAQFCQPAESTIDIAHGVSQFAKDRCCEQVDGFVPSAVLYQYYVAYCQGNGWPFLGNSQTFSTQFGQVIRQAFPNVVNTKRRVNGDSANGYKGLLLVI